MKNLRAICWSLLLLLLSTAAAPLATSAAQSDGRADSRSAAERMKPLIYAEYVRRFNAADERYAQFYSDDVVFEHGAVFGVLHGRQEIVDFYKKFWVKFHEALVVGAVVIDNERGLMAVELSTHLTARQAGVILPSHEQAMNVGDEFVTSDVVIYTLRDGKITHIRGAVEGISFTPAPAR